jgi:CRISPR-associated protein Cas5d
MGFAIEDHRQQRAGLFLRDVRYRIHGRFDFIPPGKRKYNTSSTPEYWSDSEEKQKSERQDENEGKYAAMFERRARKGQCFHRPYLGCREFACNFKLVSPAEEKARPIDKTVDLGWMLYDMNFDDPNDPMPTFFRAKMENGVVLTDRNVVEVRG